MKRETDTVAEITAAEVRTWQAEGRAFTLLDVREDFERAAASIGGIHIPLAELPRRVEEVPVGIPLVIYCHSGVRSARAAELLMRTQQRQDVLNLTGGIVAWLRG
jgi:adenylyltransferase/sulfurtransferase